MAERRSGDDSWQRDLMRSVDRKASRKADARREGDRSLWYGLGTFGLVGWSVVIPTVIGIAVGVWLDVRFESGISWTLTGLVVGVLLGSLNAWYWVQRKSRER